MSSMSERKHMMMFKTANNNGIQDKRDVLK